MPAKPTSGAPGHAPTTPATPVPRLRACRSCQTPTVPGRLVAGECPDCAGLIPLPLRGEGGRFLPGLATRSTARPDRSA
jgi:hypothetical protein